MMVINIAKIKEELLDDIEQKKVLLSKLRQIPSQYKMAESDAAFFITNSVSTIYAIWEGFVQENCQNYLREVQGLNLTKEQINTNLLVFGFENSFKQFNNYPANYPPQDKIEKKENLINNLSSFFSSPEFKILHTLNTESNLGFEALNKIMLQLNLGKFLENLELENFDNYLGSSLVNILNNTYDVVKSGKKYPLKKELDYLLNCRNAVSHGNFKSIVVNNEMISRTIKVVEIAMEQVMDKIVIACEQQKYLK
jgi:hypothetical protein